MNYYIYILCNDLDGPMYIGVTNNLEKRIIEHKNKLVKGFTNKYNIYKLVYYEVFGNAYDAISREKRLKNWHREWKNNLVLEKNPYFKDFSEILLGHNNEDPEINSG